MRKYSIAVTLICAFCLGSFVAPVGARGGNLRTTGQEATGVGVGDPADLMNAEPAIVAGDPNGNPPDSAANRVDPNVVGSSFSGVGGVQADIGGGWAYWGTGSLIHGFSPGKETVRNYILTAAHVVDYTGGQRPSGGDTGDGIVDVAPEDVTFWLNAGGSPSLVITAKSIALHPDWHGFLNVSGPEGSSVNDDLALIELEEPAPPGIPIYNVLQEASGLVEAITSVGYGRSGDGVNGYYVAPSLTVKRVGLNQMDVAYVGDEPGNPAEMFGTDFDGLDSTTNLFDLGDPGFEAGLEGTLGNDRETTLGGGDSGGPSFLTDFFSSDLTTGSDGNPIVLGVNTWTASGIADAPYFGSEYGGPFLPSYAAWIDAEIVPEPGTVTTLFGAAIAALVVFGRGRCRRRK